ncbi:protoporphyrinogen oxidase HemJ [Devosia sp. YIM 151766]|uniref:protoporphyrinogen oxidase HemJ n=1 Tax=Devosia sp. YIM 151766 TaxID=3017325 RepID=UPI00255CBE13|nr:protoporphyrinogen oxidase HemJ [Devosia sp. YIM 151766]WIY52828.1 protoporphyrinogen oxidase HemJ [Devosia sp. YIM 151766]
MIEWFKALHVISVIAWMAGLLYLPRLFVYHSVSEAGSAQSETFKVMERRLFRAITTPAMIATWIFGLAMIGHGIVDWSSFWPWAKAALVLALSGYHGLLARHLKAFARDENDKPQKYFRMINEVPTVLMVGIVIMVIVRPF